jgi:hypothetical protein
MGMKELVWIWLAGVFSLLFATLFDYLPKRSKYDKSYQKLLAQQRIDPTYPEKTTLDNYLKTRKALKPNLISICVSK